ncbi:MAG: hypothetical protein M3150_05545 [Pseudomonadota bacterium]|nr:hypothetical protein [Pseudomonadota bacterium]
MTTKTGSDSTVADSQGGDSSFTGIDVTLPPPPVAGPAHAGDGRTPQTPIVIDAASSMTGVPAEYAWLKRKFGVMEVDWTVDLRSLGRDAHGRTIETFRLRTRGGAKTDVHFDISGFHQL